MFIDQHPVPPPSYDVGNGYQDAMLEVVLHC